MKGAFHHPRMLGYIDGWLFCKKVYSCKEVSCCTWNIPLSNYLFPLLQNSASAHGWERPFTDPRILRCVESRREVILKICDWYQNWIELASNNWWSTFMWPLFWSVEKILFFHVISLRIFFSQHSIQQNKYILHHKPIFSDFFSSSNIINRWQPALL